MKQSRRGRIIGLLKQGLADDRIIDALDSEFPPGTFKTTNEAALTAEMKTDVLLIGQYKTTK